MLEIRYPDHRSALAWMAIWLLALVALALVPIDRPDASIAGDLDGIHYSYDDGSAADGRSIAEQAPGHGIEGS